MSVKLPQFLVDPNDPFNDEAENRIIFSDTLEGLINNVRQPYVCALNGAWGIGKTTFLERFLYKLKNKNLCTIFFNAWEADFAQNPFAAILSELIDEIAKMSFVESNPQQSQIIKNKTMDLAKKIGNQIVKNKFGIDILEATQDNEIDFLSDYKTYKENLKELKKNLTILAKERKIVIIIDELDRCKPNFALGVIESIKHIFDVENIFFILGVNFAQLEEYIKIIYGENAKRSKYLEKFIDLQINLPDLNIEDFTRSLIFKHSEAYYSNGLTNITDDDVKTITKYVCKEVSKYNAPLRMVQQIISHIFLCFYTISDSEQISFWALGILACIRKTDKEIYEEIKSNDIRLIEQGLKKLSKNITNSELTRFTSRLEVRYARIAHAQSLFNISKSVYIEIGVDPNQVKDYVGNINRDVQISGNDPLSKLFDKLELLSSFNRSQS